MVVAPAGYGSERGGLWPRGPNKAPGPAWGRQRLATLLLRNYLDDWIHGLTLHLPTNSNNRVHGVGVKVPLVEETAKSIYVPPRVLGS